jgi:hypothetical protein
VPDETVTASWKRLIDKVKTPCGESVYASFVDTFRTTLRQSSHADSLCLENEAASLSSPTHAETAATGCHADRNGEAMRQAARLATWEDEGGTTAFVE